jgi:hypothetical protein
MVLTEEQKIDQSTCIGKGDVELEPEFTEIYGGELKIPHGPKLNKDQTRTDKLISSPIPIEPCPFSFSFDKKLYISGQSSETQPKFNVSTIKSKNNAITEIKLDFRLEQQLTKKGQIRFYDEFNKLIDSKLAIILTLLPKTTWPRGITQLFKYNCHFDIYRTTINIKIEQNYSIYEDLFAEESKSYQEMLINIFLIAQLSMLFDWLAWMELSYHLDGLNLDEQLDKIIETSHQVFIKFYGKSPNAFQNYLELNPSIKAGFLSGPLKKEFDSIATDNQPIPRTIITHDTTSELTKEFFSRVHIEPSWDVKEPTPEHSTCSLGEVDDRETATLGLKRNSFLTQNGEKNQANKELATKIGKLNNLQNYFPRPTL